MIGPVFTRRAAPPRRGPVAVNALRTTCEGMWILQALCGIETLPATLLLRPWVAEGGPPTGHPGLAVLRAAGALVDDETVHPTIADWIHTLGCADIELCVSVRRGQDHLRMVIARRGLSHVAASRCGDDITIEQLASVRDITDLVGRILPLCGPHVEPASFDPIKVRSEVLVEGFAQMVRGVKRPLAELGLTGDQRQLIGLAADDPALEASFVVVVHGAGGEHVGLAAASITDTQRGRVVSGPVRGQGDVWFTYIVPGTTAAAVRAVTAVVASLGVTWHEHDRDRKCVPTA